VTVTAVVIFLTELTSNTATAAAFLPVVASLAVGIGQDPLLLAVPAALAATCAFMLPVATPPNAIVYGSGAGHDQPVLAVAHRPDLRPDLRVHQVVPDGLGPALGERPVVGGGPCRVRETFHRDQGPGIMPVDDPREPLEGVVVLEPHRGVIEGEMHGQGELQALGDRLDLGAELLPQR
jgi:hypothetical protein